MNTQKAMQIIDAVADGIVNNTINTSFIDSVIYGKFDRELYKHILSKWKECDGDFFSFYMGAKDEVKRGILEALSIEVEPDKFPDYDSRVMAQIFGKKRSEIYPFETEILYQFCLLGYNHSLQELKKVSPSAWQTAQENNIDLFGNYLNWSKFWTIASQNDKIALVNYIADRS